MSASYVTFTGSSSFVIRNRPFKQRMAKCKSCGIKLPREVPRVAYLASYNYRAGNYCPTCAEKLILEKKRHFENVIKGLKQEVQMAGTMLKGLEDIINDEWYPKKMALSKMLVVMEEKPKGAYSY